MNTATEGQRADIVALRAFAVAAVLLFHAALPGFRGGFIGVDVFFVISGYLMTRIIVGGLDTGRFTLAGFYLSRVRRIVPALAVMCAFVLAIGYWRLAPPDYAANAMHALTSLLFVSNFDYLRKASYFNALGSENWLLHTWSLSLEFQFYLLYPLVLVALHRWRRRPGALVWWVAGLFGLSYLLSALPARWQPWPMFYVLPTRAWEMLGGGLVCLTPFIATRAAAHRRALFWAALLALMLCVATMSSALRWPGRAALLPVLATLLMLWAHHDAAWPVRPRAVQWLGNASYSIYLWHWPLFALVMQWPLSPALGTALGVAASLVAGALSWRWVEGPGRRWWSVSKPGTWPASWALSALMLASIAGAAWVAARDGLPQREAMREYPQIVQRVRYVNLDDGACFVDNRSLNIAYRPEYSKCDRGDRAASRAVLLWGDSHAGHFEPLVDTLAQDAHVRLRVLGTPECWPTLRGEKLGINPAVCAHFRDDVVRSAKEFDTIVLAARWDATARNDWQGDLRYTLDTLSAAGKKIVVLRQVPVFDTDVAHRWVYDRLFGHTPRARYARLRDADAPNEIVRRMVTATPNARFVDATASLCAGSGSQCDVVDGDTVLYADDQHLSVDGAVLLARRLVAADQNFLR